MAASGSPAAFRETPWCAAHPLDVAVDPLTGQAGSDWASTMMVFAESSKR